MAKTITIWVNVKPQKKIFLFTLTPDPSPSFLPSTLSTEPMKYSSLPVSTFNLSTGWSVLLEVMISSSLWLFFTDCSIFVGSGLGWGGLTFCFNSSKLLTPSL